MKKLLIVFRMLIIMLTSGLINAQTASDYYLPLRVGNYLKFYTSEIVGSSWGARITTYTIEGSDSISGWQYFREKARDVMDETGESQVFRVFWLRKNSVGNVALGAMNTSTGSSNIDSATVVSAGNLFPNEFLTKGYSRTYPQGEQTYQDSVLSVTETVSVPAGTFTNCLKISDTHFNNIGTAVFREYHYYAYGIGMVKNIRTLPDSEANTEELAEYSATAPTKVSDGTANQTPRNFSLSQNYPNPFNPTTTLQYDIPKATNVTLTIYNMNGQVVEQLVNQKQESGFYSVNWDASRYSSGVYFYRLQAGNFVETKKLVLLR